MRVHSRAGIHAVATARRLPEQVDRAGSIALGFQTRKLEEGRDLHTKSVKRKGRFLETQPIVTGGVEIRRMPCLFLSRSNGGARKGAVSATCLLAKSTRTPLLMPLLYSHDAFARMPAAHDAAPDERPQRDPVSIFCFLVPVAPIRELPTMPVVGRSLALCDGHAIFSWFQDTNWNVSRAFSRKMVRPLPFAVPPALASWARVSNDAKRSDSPFDWYVLIESDTLLRPTKLRDRLAGVDASAPLAIGGAAGAMQGFSRGGLEIFGARRRVCDTAAHLDMAVDNWFETCARSLGLKLITESYFPPSDSS